MVNRHLSGLENQIDCQPVVDFGLNFLVDAQQVPVTA
jgi:hypothetical protein